MRHEDTSALGYYYKEGRRVFTTEDKIFYLPSAPIRQKTAAVFWECFDDINYFRNTASKKSLELFSIISKERDVISDNVIENINEVSSFSRQYPRDYNHTA